MAKNRRNDGTILAMKDNPLLLGVNVDHVATLRQARKSTDPSVLQAMFDCELAGCHSITVHLREDRRHIQTQDVLDIKAHCRTSLNLEISLHPDALAFALQIHPDSICLVPENRAEITTESGLDLVSNQRLVMDFKNLCPQNIRLFAFVDPIKEQIHAAKKYGLHGVEIHTGRFATAADQDIAHLELQSIKEIALLAYQLDLQVNAGHGLNFHNVQQIALIPEITELHIGHSIVARAVFSGLKTAVSQMLEILQQSLHARRSFLPW